MAINSGEDLEEERRVFHVAVTRARDELYLAVPQIFRNCVGNMTTMKPTRFLTELTKGLTEPLELEEDLPHLLGGADHGGTQETNPDPCSSRRTETGISAEFR
jgi:hypothetical protein